MSLGLVTYAGIALAKGCTYTQTRGMEPDALSLQIIPQSTAIAAVGDVVMYFGIEAITVRDCLADKSNIWMNENGFTGSVVFQDRRWRWERAQRYSWHVNERNANGEIVAASKYSLRAILQDMFDWIGEGNVDVSRVDDSFFPELDLHCIKVNELIAELCKQFGYEVCLGFGSEPVTVWPMGEGNIISTIVPEVMAFSENLDPPTNPQYSQVCFGPSVAQARFKAVPVGLEWDGTWKEIRFLSYEPADGWEKEPVTMPNVLNEHGQDAHFLATRTVYRWYAIIGFANGEGYTEDYPDGSGSLSHISQVYPLEEKLLETQFDAVTGQPSHPQPRVYGKVNLHVSLGVEGLFNIGDELPIPFSLDRDRGIVQFEQPAVYYGTGGFAGKIFPGEIYLEAAFKIRDINTRQFASYLHQIEVDSQGFGYHSYYESGLHGRTITYYDSGQNVSSTVSNQSELNLYANSLHTATAGLYTYKRRAKVWYNKLMSLARTDGLTSQVMHVVTDGTDGQPGHHTIVAQNMDFDMFIRTAEERRQSAYVQRNRREWIAEHARANRLEKANG